MKTTIRCSCGAKHVVKSTDEDDPEPDTTKEDRLYDQMTKLETALKVLQKESGWTETLLVAIRGVCLGLSHFKTAKIVSDPTYIEANTLREKYDALQGKPFDGPVPLDEYVAMQAKSEVEFSVAHDTSPEGILKRVPPEMSPTLFAGEVRFRCARDVYDRLRDNLMRSDLDVTDLSEPEGVVCGQIINSIPF